MTTKYIYSCMRSSAPAVAKFNAFVYELSRENEI